MNAFMVFFLTLFEILKICGPALLILLVVLAAVLLPTGKNRFFDIPILLFANFGYSSCSLLFFSKRCSLKN